MKQGLKMKS